MTGEKDSFAGTGGTMAVHILLSGLERVVAAVGYSIFGDCEMTALGFAGDDQRDYTVVAVERIALGVQE